MVQGFPYSLAHLLPCWVKKNTFFKLDAEKWVLGIKVSRCFQNVTHAHKFLVKACSALRHPLNKVYRPKDTKTSWGAEIDAVTIWGPFLAQGHNFWSIRATEMKILWKIRASDVLFEKKNSTNVVFSADMTGNFGNLCCQGRKVTPKISPFGP